MANTTRDDAPSRDKYTKSLPSGQEPRWTRPSLETLAIAHVPPHPKRTTATIVNPPDECELPLSMCKRRAPPLRNAGSFASNVM